ncbi:glycosyltransferase family 4 protein [Herbaspirillum sp. NPDC101397]|uniref:glycosyltransferase family 4 protein n=1 Tax=Herbaspirillum sp. NPDC101397 TaxID=3364006 RepID=UPI00383B402A
MLSQYYWPENFRINELTQSLLSQGIEVEVLTGKPNYPMGECFTGYRAWGCVKEQHGGIPVYRMPLFPRGKGAWRLALNYLSFVVSGIFFSPWMLRGKHYDIIFVFAPSPILQAIPAIWLGWIKRCPSVLWIQDLWPESLSATGYIKAASVLNGVRHVVSYIYRRMDLLLVQSRAFVPKVREQAGKTPIEYYPNSFTEVVGLTEVAAQPLLPQGDAFTILFAGNIGTAQAVEIIIDAAELLLHEPRIQFVVVGDGSRRAWMLSEVERRGLSNVTLPGRFPVEAMPSILSQASALLVTLSDSEVFRLTIPSKIQAYMAAGKPILASLNGEGATLVLEAGAGLASAAGDAQALADSVSRMYKLSKFERAAMGENARAYFSQHFSHSKLVDQLIDCLHQVVKRNKETRI